MPDISAETTRMLNKKIRIWFLEYINPIADFLAKYKVHPNLITILGALIGLLSGILFYFHHLFWGSIVLLICGLLDTLDGKVASKLNKKSLFGAIFDSTLDRYSEFFIYLGLAGYFWSSWVLWIIFFTIIGSVMVSYTRARAEGLGIECFTGIMQRAERLIILAFGCGVNSVIRYHNIVLIITLILIAGFSNFTAFQRILYVKKVERQIKQNKGG
ncbi:MAG: CDP-alcohol phosphatidyltransferase family protein [Candidatus Aminicenantia bacterium]